MLPIEFLGQQHFIERNNKIFPFILIILIYEGEMATGRSNKLVGQTGEYLVAAELSRRGLIATTFTGNVPHYDIIASNEFGMHVSVQVKASRGASWAIRRHHLLLRNFF